MKQWTWSACAYAAGLLVLSGCSGEVEYKDPSRAEVNEGLVDDARPNHTKQAIARPGRYEPPAGVDKAGRREAREADFSYTGSPAWRGGEQCSGGFLAGAERFADFMENNFEGVTRTGGYNCRPIRGNASVMSVHGTGRAVDLFIPLDGEQEDNDLGNPAANYLIEHASELGVEFFIWDWTKWNIDYAEDRKYNGAHPHHDHIHVELTPHAARHLDSFPDPGSGASSDSTGGSNTSSSDSSSSAPPRPDGVSPNWTDIANGGSASLDWDASRRASEYSVSAQHNSSGTWEDYYTWDTDDAGFRIWPQKSDTEFRWRIRACNHHGCSDWTDWRVIQVGSVPGSSRNSTGSGGSTSGTTRTESTTDGRADRIGSGLSAPSLHGPPSGDRVYGESVNYEWADVSGADHYDLQMRYRANGEWQTYYMWEEIGSASKTVFPVIDDFEFAWRVRACDGSTCSDWSAWSTFYFAG